jgi:hypothetical protein
VKEKHMRGHCRPNLRELEQGDKGERMSPEASPRPNPMRLPAFGAMNARYYFI